jgi:hypothetical protein
LEGIAASIASIEARRDEVLKINGQRMGVARTTWSLRTGTLRDGDTAAGTLALQARVAVDGVVGMLDDVAEPGGFMMIGADGDPLDVLDAALAGGWRSMGGVGVHFGTNGWLDVDDKYRGWFDTLGARVLLIRPDFHVFGTSSGDARSTNLLVADLLRCVTRPND